MYIINLYDEELISEEGINSLFMTVGQFTGCREAKSWILNWEAQLEEAGLVASEPIRVMESGVADMKISKLIEQRNL